MSLPVPRPTEAYWQYPMLSYCRPLPSTADVVIIGSGITGTCIAHKLSHTNPNLSILILEARSLCSGATGRNGGHIKPGSYHSWSHRVSEYGIDEAIRISRFENMHPRAMAEYAREYEIDCDVEQLDTVDAYFDEGGFNRAKAAVQEILQHIPELNYKIHTAEEAQENLRLAPTCVGAITYAAGKLWPYKFVSQIIQLLVTKGVNIQTETPATGITRDGDKWRIITPRGSILTQHIVHATNGYTEYLLPEFHDLITPTRGHMTAQIPPTSLSVPPLEHTYSFIYSKGRFDYFIQQPEYDGCKLMLGGGYYEDPCPTSYEDNTTSEEAQRYLRQQLPKVFKWKGEEDPEKRVYMKWSGIMGFSGDGLPWVGPLSEELGGKGQWVCAGYTGEGMVNALLCAETVAMMILEMEPPVYFPRSYLVSSERVRKVKEDVLKHGRGTYTKRKL